MAIGGFSFDPSQRTLPMTGTGGRGPSRLSPQQAVKILSLRVPQTLPSNAPVSRALLTAPGGQAPGAGGLNSMIQQLIEAFKPSGVGAGPSLPSPGMGQKIAPPITGTIPSPRMPPPIPQKVAPPIPGTIPSPTAPGGSAYTGPLPAAPIPMPPSPAPALPQGPQPPPSNIANPPPNPPAPPIDTPPYGNAPPLFQDPAAILNALMLAQGRQPFDRFDISGGAGLVMEPVRQTPARPSPQAPANAPGVTWAENLPPPGGGFFA